jgi:hypothetical protein
MAQITLNSTGVASSGALALQSNGTTTAVTIDTSQNVGIGTATPTNSSGYKTLEIVGTATTTGGMLRMKTSDASVSSLDFTDTNGRGIFAISAHPVRFGTNDTERMRINAGAPILCLSGGSTTATGTGIAFPATQSASSDANTLDDYEEGTFTPTLIGGFSSGPTSYIVQTGVYTKIGRVVYFFLDLDSEGATANASTITIGGLPFTSTTPASSGRGGAYVTYQINFDTNTVDSFLVDQNSTQIVVFGPDGNGRLGNAANININGRIGLSGFYLT